MNNYEQENVVQRFAKAWFQELDVHAPPEDFEPMLDGDDVELHFPEGVFRGISGFRLWYANALKLFFDEEHVVKQVEVSPGTGLTIAVKVVVHWEASTWKSPEARSRRIKLDAYQTWELVPAISTNSLAIRRYVVDRLQYDADSARL